MFLHLARWIVAKSGSLRGSDFDVLKLLTVFGITSTLFSLSERLFCPIDLTADYHLRP